MFPVILSHTPAWFREEPPYGGCVRSHGLAVEGTVGGLLRVAACYGAMGWMPDGLEACTTLKGHTPPAEAERPPQRKLALIRR